MQRQATLDLWVPPLSRTKHFERRKLDLHNGALCAATSVDTAKSDSQVVNEKSVIEVDLIDSPTKSPTTGGQETVWAAKNFFDDSDDEVLNSVLEHASLSDIAPKKRSADHFLDKNICDFDVLDQEKPSTSDVRSDDALNCDDFDAQAGQTWTYPTNRPFRQYQYDISKTCLFNNTLVTLPTGLGKTFIAAVVMFNFYRWYPRGKIIFMAPTKPLVAQQIAACYEIMAIPQEDMAEMTGTMHPQDRIAKWNSKRIFFMTPQVMSNDLSARGDEIMAHRIKCVVFDEAHRATGNYAYCQVIRELLQYTKRFRVLALSATPGKDTTVVQQVISNLLIAKLELRNENSPEMREFSHSRNIEKIVVKQDDTLKYLEDLYIKVLEKYIEPLNKAQVLQVRDIRNYDKFSLLQARDRMRISNTKYSKQPGYLEYLFAASMSLSHGLELLLLHGQRTCYTFLQGLIGDEAQKIGNPRLKGELLRNENFAELMKTLCQKYGQIVDCYTQMTRAQDMVLSHPKLRCLVNILLDHFGIKESDILNDSNVAQHCCRQETRVIIFSQYRDSVEEIASLLRKYSPLIKPMKFVGQSSASGKMIKGFSQKEQLRVVKEFKKGNYNTLIATCVGEEGLDIAEVDLIICYDSPKSPIRLVQRMGRTGRNRLGRVVVLLTEGKEEQMYKRSEYQKSSILKAIQQASKKFHLSSLNPRMVPAKFTPHCVKSPMEKRTPFDGVKVRRKDKTSSATMFRNVAFLTESQLRIWKSKMGNPANTEDGRVAKKFTFGRRLFSDSVDLTNSVEWNELNLNRYYLWQNESQHCFSVGHATSTQLLSESIKKCQYFNQFSSDDFRINDFYYVANDEDVEFDVLRIQPNARTPSGAVKLPKASPFKSITAATTKQKKSTIDRFRADVAEIEFYNVKHARGLGTEDFFTWKKRILAEKSMLNDCFIDQKINNPVKIDAPLTSESQKASKRSSQGVRDAFKFDLCESFDDLFGFDQSYACNEKRRTSSDDVLPNQNDEPGESCFNQNFDADFSFDFTVSENESSMQCARKQPDKITTSPRCTTKQDDDKPTLLKGTSLHNLSNSRHSNQFFNVSLLNAKALIEAPSDNQRISCESHKCSTTDIAHQTTSHLFGKEQKKEPEAKVQELTKEVQSRQLHHLDSSFKLSELFDDWSDAEDFVVPPSPERPRYVKTSQLLSSQSRSSNIPLSRNVGGVNISDSLSQNVIGVGKESSQNEKIMEESCLLCPDNVDQTAFDLSNNELGSQSPIFRRVQCPNSNITQDGSIRLKPLATVRPYRINDTVVGENVLRSRIKKRKRSSKYGNEFVNDEADVSVAGCSRLSSDESESSSIEQVRPNEWFMEDSFVDLNSQPEYLDTQRKIDSPTQMQAIYLKSLNNSMALGRRNKFKLAYERLGFEKDAKRPSPLQTSEKPYYSGYDAKSSKGIFEADFCGSTSSEDEADGQSDFDSFVVPNDYVEYMTQNTPSLEIFDTQKMQQRKRIGGKKKQRLQRLICVSDSD